MNARLKEVGATGLKRNRGVAIDIEWKVRYYNRYISETDHLILIALAEMVIRSRALLSHYFCEDKCHVRFSSLVVSVLKGPQFTS